MFLKFVAVMLQVPLSLLPVFSSQPGTIPRLPSLRPDVVEDVRSSAYPLSAMVTIEVDTLVDCGLSD